MNREELPSILCVDDEPRIVESLAVQLRRDYQVLAANGGNSALQLLKDKGAPAVIISDMRMPGMDGATLLKHVKQLYPETTRILLTGEPGRDAAIAAVNEGQIFRFLTKPCPLEAAAMLSQIGYISWPTELVEKLYYGKRLTSDERALADGAPAVAQKLLGRIPRLEQVMEILAASHTKVELPDGLIKDGAGILRLVLEYDAQIAQRHSPEVSLSSLRAQSGRFGVKLVENLESLVGLSAGAPEVKQVAVGGVTPGMVFMDDLYTQIGTLLVPNGFEVTEAFLERARNFGPAILQEKVRMLAPVKSGG